MTSGSKAEEEEVGEADLSYAAEAMAKSTKIPKKIITEMWDKNGELSAQLGTVVHDAFDYYIKRQEQMKHYDSVQERDHTAKNWFPNTVGSIIDLYLERHSVEQSRGEVFVRYGDYCGFIDQLVYLGMDIVQIRDYKIINKLKKVKTKSFGTVHKYTVQQNFYRAILEANGLKVVSMEINAFDGDSWEDVELERVKINVGQEDKPGINMQGED